MSILVEQILFFFDMPHNVEMIILQYVMGGIKDEIEEKKRQFEKACPQSVLFYCIFITGDRRRAKVNASPSLIRSGTTNGITHQARTIVRLTAPFA